MASQPNATDTELGDQVNSSKPKHQIKVPMQAQQSVKERADAKHQYEQRQLVKKRKILAEERPNSAQPGPLSEAERASKKLKQAAQTSILDYLIDELAEESDQIEWYLAAVLGRDGKDLLSDKLSIEKLKQAWLQPTLAAEEGGEPSVAQQSAKQTIIELGQVTYNMEPKSKKIASPSRKPLPRLDSTDHKTIMPHGLVNPKHPRGPDGKPVPEELLYKKRPVTVGQSAKGKQAVTLAPDTPRSKANSTVVPVIRVQQASPNTLNGTSGSIVLSTSKDSLKVPKAGATIKPKLDTPKVGVAIKPKSDAAKVTGKMPNKPGKAIQEPLSGKNNRTLSEVESTEQEDEAGDSTTEDESAPSPAIRLTRRAEAQLNRFGQAIPIVTKLRNIIHVRAITENAFADLTINWSEADKNGIQRSLGPLFESWVLEEWTHLNGEMRPGKSPLPLLQAYIDNVKTVFSTVCNEAFVSLGTSVETEFKLERTGKGAENRKAVKDLLLEAFLSPTRTPRDPHAFSSDLMKTNIWHCYFESRGKGWGHIYPHHFSPMPFAVFALFAVMMHVRISHFGQGDYNPLPLVAEEQAPLFNMYMALLEKLRGKLPICMVNLQRQTFDFCHPNQVVKRTTPIEVPEIDFDDDDEEEYVQRVIVEKPAPSFHLQQHLQQPPSNRLHMPKPKQMVIVLGSAPPPEAGPSGLSHISGHAGRQTRDDGTSFVKELVFTDESSD